MWGEEAQLNIFYLNNIWPPLYPGKEFPLSIGSERAKFFMYLIF
jgi:hypothetical protein